ncbi:tRNA 2'-phosphotransferase [Sorochytrium milnesiophthora]
MPPKPDAASHDVRLSKLLSRVLRHQAVAMGFRISSDGFIPVDDLLQHRDFRRYSFSDLQRVVADNDKQRFVLACSDSGKWRIRANQGHSMRTVADVEMQPILAPGDVRCAVHGTRRAVWPAIRAQGLSRMARNHVHFAEGMPDDDRVVSGMRGSSDLFVHLDVEAALRDGMKLYKSANGVILTDGFDGIIPPRYFSRVVDRAGVEYTGVDSEPVDAAASTPPASQTGGGGKSSKSKKRGTRKAKTSNEGEETAPPSERLIERCRRRLAEIAELERKAAAQEPVEQSQWGKVRHKAAIQQELDQLLAAQPSE